MENESRTVLPAHPPGLIELRQWLLWRRQDRAGRITKVPHTVMGYRASVTNPDHWSTYETVLRANARPGFCDGIGFVFTENDPYCGLDLDNCYPTEEGECAPWAAGILERFADTYSEVSPSGKGVKIWSLARAARCGKWLVDGGAIEIYDRGRFFTVTGNHAGILTIANHQSDIDQLIANLDKHTSDDGEPRETHVIPEKIAKGKRHNTLVSVAGTLYRRGVCAQAILAALEAMNKHQCEPPYEPEHIAKIIKSMEEWER